MEAFGTRPRQRCAATRRVWRSTATVLILWAAMAVVPLGGAVAASRFAALLEGCVPCHGGDGIARDSEVPHLAGQNELYLINQMRAFRAGTRVHAEMAYMMHDVDDDTIAALAAYFAELPPRP
jgi:cytochrome c553